MGYFLTYVIGLLILALTELLFALILGVIGAYVAAACFLGILFYEMYQAVKNGKPNAAKALLVAGACIVLTFTVGVLNVPEKTGLWKHFSTMMEEMYVSGGIGDGTALLVQFLLWFWVFLGGALIVHAFGQIIEVVEGRGDEYLLAPWTALIVLWGVTAGSYLGWFLGGLPGAVLGKF